MTEKKKRLIIFVCIGLVVIFAGIAVCAFWCGQIADKTKIEYVTDTVVVTDTVFVETTIVDSTFVGRVTQIVPVRGVDSCSNDIVVVSGVPPDSDSIVIDIPIQQKVYETAYYKAFVSGYKPELDSISIYQKTKTVTNTIVERVKPKRWCGVVGVGAGYDGRRFSPYMGVTVGYRLF